MDLTTTYLGLKLPHPLIVGASPMVDDLDMVKRLADAGAAAIVMHSLFEEQIVRDQLNTFVAMEGHTEAYAEATTYLPRPEEFHLGPDQYLKQIAKVKRVAEVPVIASLNGASPAGWQNYASLIQDAGADALELNVYYLAADMEDTGRSVEQRVIETVRAVRETVKIPLSVKLSPHYSSIPEVVRKLEDLKIQGVVLFNRFYQPDIDPETLEVKPTLHLSDSSELLLRLRWLAILSGRINMSLACSGGVHTGLDAIKAIMAGADCVQLVSVLLRNGPQYLASIRRQIEDWMTENEYYTLSAMRGCLNLLRSPDPASYERANYMRVLQSYKL